MKHRFLAVFAALCIAIVALPTIAFAETNPVEFVSNEISISPGDSFTIKFNAKSQILDFYALVSMPEGVTTEDYHTNPEDLVYYDTSGNSYNPDAEDKFAHVVDADGKSLNMTCVGAYANPLREGEFMDITFHTDESLTAGDYKIIFDLTADPTAESYSNYYVKKYKTSGAEKTIPLANAFTRTGICISNDGTSSTYADCENMTFTVHVADYTAYFTTDTTSVKADGTFTADLYMKSDKDLATGQVDFAVTNGTVTNIALADGVTNDASSINEDKKGGLVSFYGNTASAKDGLKVATVTIKADSALTSTDQVTLAVNADKSKAGVSGKTAALAVAAGDAVSVAIEEPDMFEVSQYTSKINLIKYTGTVADGNIVKYGENVMNWSDKYNAFVCVTTDATDTIKNSNFTVEAGTKTSIGYTGDVNADSSTDIVDAQIAYDMSKAVYDTIGTDAADTTKATANMWYSADVNGDKAVTAADARAIQCIIHGITVTE